MEIGRLEKAIRENLQGLGYGGECDTGCQTAGRGEAFARRIQKSPGLTSTNASPLRLSRNIPTVGQEKKDPKEAERVEVWVLAIGKPSP